MCVRNSPAYVDTIHRRRRALPAKRHTRLPPTTPAARSTRRSLWSTHTHTHTTLISKHWGNSLTFTLTRMLGVYEASEVLKTDQYFSRWEQMWLENKIRKAEKDGERGTEIRVLDKKYEIHQVQKYTVSTLNIYKCKINIIYHVAWCLLQYVVASEFLMFCKWFSACC